MRRFLIGLFLLVVCKDVLPYMPSEMLGVAADNLARLSGKYLLVGWRVGDKHSGIPHSALAESDMVALFERRGLRMDRFQTSRLRMALNETTYGVFVNTHV